ncbi:MAG: hypothetical protein U5L76_05540 [Patescibacteria group bacterium]|nr:hypothetical protein [Patescibacteria group bacterium]
MVLLLGFLVVLITVLPYLYGYFSRPANTVYTGIHNLTPGDTNAVLSLMEQVKQGNFIFKNLYTAEPQDRIYTNPFWLSAGLIAKVFKLPNLFTLHFIRSVLIIVFVVVLYLFLRYFIEKKRLRIWSFVVILFSSGLGLFFNPFFINSEDILNHPTDIWVPESITFLTLYNLPHQIASLILIILVFLFMFLAFENNRYKYSLMAGIFSFLLLWFHPFNGPTIYGVLGVYLLAIFFYKKKIIWSYIKHYIILCLIPLPVLLYFFLINQADWVIKNWAKQNILLSPSLWMYLIGYGFLVPLAVYGLYKLSQKKDKKNIFIISWFITSSLLLYSPLSFQRRLSEGLHIPLTILAMAGVFYLTKKWHSKEKGYNLKAYAIFIFLLIFLPLTNIQIVSQDIYIYKTDPEFPYYLGQEEVLAMQWIKKNSSDQSIIFSSYLIGNFIPAYSGRRVWIGHGPQTINLEKKKEINKWFWQEDNLAKEKYKLLKKDNIDYLWYGQREKEMGTFNPKTKDYLKKIYNNGKVDIYQVIN